MQGGDSNLGLPGSQLILFPCKIGVRFEGVDELARVGQPTKQAVQFMAVLGDEACGSGQAAVATLHLHSSAEKHLPGVWVGAPDFPGSRSSPPPAWLLPERSVSSLNWSQYEGFLLDKP